MCVPEHFVCQSTCLSTLVARAFEGACQSTWLPELFGCQKSKPAWQTGVRSQDRCSKQGGVVLDQHAGLRQSWQCACHKQQAGGLLQAKRRTLQRLLMYRRTKLHSSSAWNTEHDRGSLDCGQDNSTIDGKPVTSTWHPNAMKFAATMMLSVAAHVQECLKPWSVASWTSLVLIAELITPRLIHLRRSRSKPVEAPRWLDQALWTSMSPLPSS